MNIYEANHFVLLMSFLKINKVFLPSGSIEPVLVYDSKKQYKGDITISLMKDESNRGFLFIECDHRIIKIIDILTIKSIKSHSHTDNYFMLDIVFSLASCVSFIVYECYSFFNFNFVPFCEQEGE